MSAFFQVTADVADVERYRAAIEWIRESVAHPPGFISMRFLSDAARPERMTILEEWAGADAFMASLREQGPTAGPEFLQRVGIPQEEFSSALWTPSGITTIEAEHPEAR